MKAFALVAFFAIFTAFLLYGCTQEQPPVLPSPPPPPASVEPGLIIEVIENNATQNNNTRPSNENASITPPPPAQKPKSTGINYTASEGDLFTAYFVKVGDEARQGDAILVKKGDLDVLIDAGPKENAEGLVNFLNGRGVDDVELMVSTHADPEHYGGMAEVMKNFNVEEFWWSGKAYGDSDYEGLVSGIKGDGIPVKIVSRGDNMLLNGMEFKIMNPDKGDFSGADASAMSIKISQNNFCLLLTSDILVGAQTDMANKLNIKCELLQLPYHGLGTGTNQIDTFLLKVNPKIAIASGGTQDELVGKVGSRFTVMEKLRLKGIKFYENYYNGTLRIVGDGMSYTINHTAS